MRTFVIAALIAVACACSKAEAGALQDLYDSLGGAKWKKSWDKKSIAKCSGLHGVTVKNGAVVAISLAGNGLAGTLPKTLSKLTALTWLDLSTNWKITGAIPSGLLGLPALTTLDLSETALSGSLPSFKSTSLQVLDLSYTSLSGSFDGLFSVVSLTNLSLAGSTNLTSVSPLNISSLVHLEYLNLSSLPQLSLPFDEFPLDLINLTVLDISHTPLTGSIPADISELSNLEILDLNSAGLTGTLPESIVNLTKLVYLNLSSNHLEGIIPSALANHSGIAQLFLGNNSWACPLPEGQWDDVKVTVCSDSSAPGPITAKILAIAGIGGASVVAVVGAILVWLKKRGINPDGYQSMA